MKKHWTIRKLIKISVFILLMGLILLAGITLRNMLLHEMEKKLESLFSYSRVQFGFMPPELIFEEVQLAGETPRFTASRMVVRANWLSLFSREKPLRIFLDEPVIRLGDSGGGKTGKGLPVIPPPFILEEALIRDGDVTIQRESESIHGRSLKAIWKQRGDRFSLQVEGGEVDLHLSGRDIVSSARLKMFIEGQGQRLTVRRLLLEGEDRYIRLQGTIVNPLDPRLNLKGSFRFPMASIAGWIHLPFTWEGSVSSEGLLVRQEGRWSYEGKVRSSDLAFNDYQMGKTEGSIALILGGEGNLHVLFERASGPAELSLSWGDGGISGKMSRFHLDPIMKGIHLPWPVKSPAWGTFTLVRGRLQTEIEFRETDLLPEGKLYPLRGSVQVSWDGQRQVRFFSPELISPFCRIQVDGEVDLSRALEVQIKGEIVDIRQTRFFLQDLLGRTWNFPEIRGQAETLVRLSGNPSSPNVAFEFEAAPAGFGRFEVAKASGTVRISSGQFSGDFQFFDPELTGKAQVTVDGVGIRAEFNLQEGELSKVLPALTLNLPLRGRVAGKFQLEEKEGFLSAGGNFSSSRMFFLDQTLEKVAGQISWKNNLLDLENFQGLVAGGSVAGKLRLDFPQETFALTLQSKGIHLEQLLPSLRGKLDLNLEGRGILGKDKAKGSFEIRDLALSFLKKDSVKGEVAVSFTSRELVAQVRGRTEPQEAGFDLQLTSSFVRPEYSVSGKGKTSLDSVIPWKGIQGDMSYLFEIRSEQGKSKTTGVIEAYGSLLPIPGFAHALTDYSLLMFIQDRGFSIRSFQGRLGGGEVQGFGEIKQEKGGFVSLDLQLDGRDMVLSPLERTRFWTDGSLRLVRSPERFLLEGTFDVKNGSWKREFFEKISFLASSGKEPASIPLFLQGLNISLRFRADDQVWVENSLGRIRGRFDLTVNGEVGSPVILGDIEALDGEIYFQDRNFRLLKGKLSFLNPLSSVPYLEMKGETYLQDYRVTFSLAGPTDRLKPEFTSSPPLSPEEVLALLAFGESFKRITSTDVAARMSTASFLSAEIIEEAKKQAQKILSLDRLRVDPFVLGSSAEITARLTVGKKVSENFFILYSTNLTTQREEIVRIEWQLRPGLSIVGIRDEMGRISFDFKIRKRF